MSEEQCLLRDMLSSYFAANLSHEKRAVLLGSGEASIISMWRHFAKELGVLGVAFPEEMGGTGGNIADSMVVMNAIGEFVVPLPFLETILLCGRLLLAGGGSGATALIPQIITGDTIVALAHAEPHSRDCWSDVTTSAAFGKDGLSVNGRKIMVYSAPLASHLIVSARTQGARRDEHGISLYLIESDRPGVSVRNYRLIDGSAAGDVLFDNVRVSDADLVGRRDGAGPLILQALQHAVAALCAEAVGCMRAMLNQTVDYSRQRVQFGVPISSFQVLQHRMVDMYVMLEHATSFADAAARSLENAELARWMIPAAKAYVGKAGNFVGYFAVQIHGGIGLMEETPISHFFRRMKVIEGQYGSTDHHLDNYSRMAGVSVPPDRILSASESMNCCGEAR